MEVGLLLKVCGVGFLVAFSCQILSKSGREEQALLVSLAGMVLVLLLLVEQIGQLVSALSGGFGL
ncbi:MAG: stage III sporulation protein AC [Clostridia bacterium]|nr:stage III sporulation protein AC [Clostridia bacterium]